MTDAKVTISRETLLPAATIKRIKKECDALGLDIVAFAWRVQNAALAAQPSEPSEPPKPVADALDRMDALLDPKAGLLTVGYDSATARASRWDMQIIRAALAAQPSEPMAWKHDCAGLCTNDVELWIDACPHCGKPRNAQPIEHWSDCAVHNAPAPAAVPPGWKLVPIEPTPGMIASGAVALVKASHSDIDPTMEEVTAAYHAMIRAAGDKS